MRVSRAGSSAAGHGSARIGAIASAASRYSASTYAGACAGRYNTKCTCGCRALIAASAVSPITESPSATPIPLIT